MRLIYDILVGLTMAASLALYYRGAMRLRARSERGIRWYEGAAFVAGWMAIAAALLSPIDRLADVLFSMHMTQHELLMVVAAPLLVAGRPMIAGVWGLSDRARDAVLRATRAPATLRAWHALTHPFVVLVLHAAVLWAWHIPAAFESALHDETIHAVQHLMFFVTAALFWWALVHGRYGRAGYGLAVFFVFATAMHTSILGALFTFAQRLWYPSYGSLEDQQLAGLIMWVPSGLIFILAGLALFAAWLGESERRARASGTLTMLLFLAACSEYPGDRIAEARQLTGGEPERGEKAIRQYGCGACHTIPGIPGAVATVGPPLDKLAMRGYLAGRLVNSPDNLLRWIRHPQSIDPKTAMPDMAVTERDGRDIAAYLYTLK
ncbi:MAG TPA: cytochrome c oxidase assembly protein [Thermoanaerobaculia bacterium]|nr:cytochrome c oxidase assembly protein [Thermoanaerobaculia bacterium]